MVAGASAPVRATASSPVNSVVSAAVLRLSSHELYQVSHAIPGVVLGSHQPGSGRRI